MQSVPVVDTTVLSIVTMFPAIRAAWSLTFAVYCTVTVAPAANPVAVPVNVGDVNDTDTPDPDGAVIADASRSVPANVEVRSSVNSGPTYGTDETFCTVIDHVNASPATTCCPSTSLPSASNTLLDTDTFGVSGFVVVQAPAAQSVPVVEVTVLSIDVMPLSLSTDWPNTVPEYDTVTDEPAAIPDVPVLADTDDAAGVNTTSAPDGETVNAPAPIGSKSVPATVDDKSSVNRSPT